MFANVLRPLCRFASSKKSLYDVLRVSRGASQDEIKASYYKLAKQYHPDTHQGSSNIAEMFKQTNQAYNILRDQQKRRQYDEQNFTPQGQKKEYKFYDSQHTYGYSQKTYRKNPYQSTNPFESTFQGQNSHRQSGANPYNSDFSSFYKQSQSQSQKSPNETWQEYVRNQHRKNVAQGRKIGINRLKRSNAIMYIVLGVVSVYIIGELTFKIYQFNNFYRTKSYAQKLDPMEIHEYQQQMRYSETPRKDYY